MNCQPSKIKVFLFAGILLAIFIFGAASVEAANWYVRQGATGSNNGTDWTNAYTSLPPTLTRGDTYYIADGSYSSYTFDDAESGSTYITIKKATVADHGTSTGWNDTYGDGQAVMGSIMRFYSGYYVLDGNGTHTVPSNNTNDYGFKISSNTSSNILGIVQFGAYGLKAQYITMKYVHVYNTTNGNIHNGTTGVRFYGVETQKYIKLTNNFFENSGKDGFEIPSANHVLIERNYIKRYGMWHNQGTPDYHGQTVAIFYGGDDIIFRWNLWEANEGQGLIQIAGINNTSNNIRFYGNVVFENYAQNPDSPGFNYSGGIFGNAWNNNAINNVYLYNNTFVNIGGDYGGVTIFPNVGPYSNWYSHNNLFYNCETTTKGAWTAYGYHASGGGDTAGGTSEQTGLNSSIFQSYTGDNFRLASGTTAGLTLTSQSWWSGGVDSFFGQLDYNTDMYGNIHGIDGVWDRGAYEYLASNPPPSDTASPSIPTNLTAQAISSSQINLSWIASTDNVGVLGYRIFRDSSQLSTVTGQLSYSDTNLSPSTSYTYTVSAYDAAGNNSNQSSPVSTTTQSASPPTGNLLLNPDFEGGFTSNLANNWNITTDGSIGYLLSQDTGYQGLSQKINISSPGSWGLFYYQTPSFQLNQFYDWSFWYKTLGTGSLRAQITNAPQTQTILSESLPPTNNQWTYKTINFQYTNSLANQLRFSSNSTSPYWIDNIQLAVASADTTPPSAPSGLAVQ
ncbi:MAG: fibronectin type III domain-containing protein [Patescibacteria group bacterium]